MKSSMSNTSVGDDRVHAPVSPLDLLCQLRVPLCVGRQAFNDRDAPVVLGGKIFQRRGLCDITHAGIDECIRAGGQNIAYQTESCTKIG